MTRIRRRDLVRVAAATGVAAIAGSAAAPSASDETSARQNKRRPQYQADSPEVQTFYRVNRYPAK
jgi:hypothetical protein